MGCCCANEIGRLENIRLANRVFGCIDIKKTGQLDRQNLQTYFEEYTDSSVKIILNEIDLNRDGIITKGEWMAFWEYVREAGYQQKQIRKALKALEAGTAQLGFTRASSYRVQEPRQTLIKGIQQKIKDDPNFATILIQPS